MLFAWQQNGNRKVVAHRLRQKKTFHVMNMHACHVKKKTCRFGMVILKMNGMSQSHTCHVKGKKTCRFGMAVLKMNGMPEWHTCHVKKKTCRFGLAVLKMNGMSQE